jgi:hypothetical protein
MRIGGANRPIGAFPIHRFRPIVVVVQEGTKEPHRDLTVADQVILRDANLYSCVLSVTLEGERTGTDSQHCQVVRSHQPVELLVGTS